MTAKRKKQARSPAAAAHRDHLRAHQDHDDWMKDVERWREEYLEAIRQLAQRLLPDFDLEAYEDAIERHEAAIVTHEELVDQHEQRLRRQRAGQETLSEEVEALHVQMHGRHEVSRREHSELEKRHRLILEALRDLETDVDRPPERRRK